MDAERTIPLWDGPMRPDQMRRNRLTARFTLIAASANLAFGIYDLIRVDDLRMGLLDLGAVLYFFSLYAYFLVSRDQVTTKTFLLIGLNLWFFYNAGYYGDDALFLLFELTLIPMGYFLVDHRHRFRLSLFMAMPAIGVLVHEVTGYALFRNAGIPPEVVSEVRLLSILINLAMLYLFLDSMVRNGSVIDGMLLDRQVRLQKMAHRLRELNAIKEQYNAVLEERLRTALSILARKEQELDASARASEDRVRTTIAQDLHDGIGALLSTLKHRLSDLDEAIVPGRKREVADLLVLIDAAGQEVRNTAHALHPTHVCNLGLPVALHDLAQQVNAAKRLVVHVDTLGYDSGLGLRGEQELYRIVLELLNNTLRHSDAANFRIQVMLRDGEVVLTTEDDGKGYDPKAVEQGLGVRGMERRVSSLGGSWSMDPGNGSGVVTIVEVPLSPSPGERVPA